MKYRTVEEVIDFVTELRAEDTSESQLKIHVEFYNNGIIVGVLDRDMHSTYTTTTLKSISLLSYVVEEFKIEMREYCIAFVLSIKNPSGI